MIWVPCASRTASKYTSQYNLSPATTGFPEFQYLVDLHDLRVVKSDVRVLEERVLSFVAKHHR